MKVPFIDLRAQYKEIKPDVNAALRRVLQKQDFILGEDVRLFEQEFARSCGARYAVGVSSGTAALFLSLKCFGIGAGDEVLVPDFTFIATAMAVSYTGAKPVFVDIEDTTYNIDTDKIRKAITRKTKAIIPVHLFGQPANMPEIMKIAKQHNLRVIEDACQAHGAMIRMPAGKCVYVGSIGDTGCFSFYPTKNLGGFGDGGIVTTNNERIYRDLLILRDCGRVSKYEHAVVGYNSRLDSMQAAGLRVKLKKLDRWNAKRKSVAKIYGKLLQDIDGVVTPCVEPGATHVFHVYAIRTKKRDRVFQVLRDKGVAAVIHYPIPLHLQKAYKDLGHIRGDFSVSEMISQEILSLPMYPHLQEAQVRYVVKTIQEALAG